MGMTETRHPEPLPADEGTFWCNKHRPHQAHPFTVGSDYGPTYEGHHTTCPGLTWDDFDTHTCADPGCPCVSPKQGVSGETAAQHQDRPTAHDVDQHGDEQ